MTPTQSRLLPDAGVHRLVQQALVEELQQALLEAPDETYRPVQDLGPGVAT